MTEISRIGFVGIGRMGYPMAGHLVKAGFAVSVADADPAAVERFVHDHGADAADSLADLARRSDAVVTMLPTGTIVRAVVLGDERESDCLADGLSAGKIVIDCGTSNPMDTRRLGTDLRDRGIGLVDAPVAGGRVFAQDGSLDITVGGDPALVARCRGVFEAMGRKVVHCGDLGSGHAMKALNNSVNATVMMTFIEALALGRRFGLDVDMMVESMTAASLGRNHPFEKKVVAQVLTRRFASNMALGLIAKDTSIAADMARAMGAFAPVAEQCSSLLSAAVEAIGGNEDQTCVARMWEEKNDVTLAFEEN